MKLLGSFLQLVRFPNLIFIALTQCLFYFFIMLPLQRNLPQSVMNIGVTELLLIITASVFIAGGGYVINDYFDLSIDRVNKPYKLIVDRTIKRRWAIVWHLVLSVAGLLPSFLVSYRIGNILPFLFNSLSVFLLWLYSTSYKRQLVIGNIVIALLTAWVVLILYVCELRYDWTNITPQEMDYVTSVYKAAILFGGFAFLLTVIREVVKDLEDMEGDARYQCRTIPIVWGIRSAKIYTMVWVIVLISSLCVLTVYAFMLQWWILGTYLIIAVIIPLFSLISGMNRSYHPKDFGWISQRIKWIMLSGIFSMLFFRIYL